MTQRLRKVVFCEALLPLVKDFHCGDEPWDREVSGWIHDPGGALRDMHGKRPCSVWLHINDNDSIVGFSSLCESNWAGYPKLSIIPNVAVSTEFQGHGYFREIMEHCVDEAIAAHCDEGRIRMLGLFVHPQNQKAIAIYEQCFGFERFSQVYHDKATGITYIGMIRRV